MTRARDLADSADKDISGTVVLDDITLSNDISIADNGKALFGDGDDLQIYHETSTGNSRIVESGSGHLNIEAANLNLKTPSGENYINCNEDGTVLLRYDNEQKLSTTSTGVAITGNATFADNGKAIFGAGSDLQIYHQTTGTAGSYIAENGTGDLRISGNNLWLNDASGDTYFRAVNGSYAKLYHAGAEKISTVTTGVEVTGKTTSDAVDLTAIAKDISDTAVDVFVYDTSKDSDGGAWRKRTQGTSWYNETLNTATRGSRKEFPAVAVIVAESNQVTIYDGDDPDLPMWMVFNPAGYKFVWSYTSSVAAMNSIICVGGLSGTGLHTIDFIEDTGYFYTASSEKYSKVRGSIADRSVDATAFDLISTTGTINSTINDVAMTVLPNAPIDAATGLPVPTIAVATDGGVSVLKDDGTVVDITFSTGGYTSLKTISFAYNNWISVGHSDPRAVKTFPIPASDKVYSYWMYNVGVHSYYESKDFGGGYGTQAFLQADSVPPKVIGGRAIGTNNGLTSIAMEPYPAPDQYGNGSLLSYITSDYNTGYMVGDIKLATLSDTDDTDVTGTELVTNGTFDSNTTGWTANNATLSVDAGRLKIVDDGSSAVALQTISVTAGETYVISFNATAGTASCQAYVTDGTFTVIGSTIPNGVFSYTYTAPSGVSSFDLGLNNTNGITGQYCFFDNVSVRLAEEDRSVNGNGLQVFGTVTKNPVATGADLVGYSGFSASNYLEQPYNSDLDFGTGDFSMTWWFKSGGDNGNYQWLFERQPGELEAFTFSGTGILRVYVGGTAIETGQSVFTGSWSQLCFVRRNGIGSLYLDGQLKNSTTMTGDMSTNNSSPLTVGARNDGTYPVTTHSLALLRISATAPTPEQIAKIYNDEKVLFQEGAQATLYGSSDAVTALAYDDTTELLHVGTSGGRSVFQGLRRVDNTTDAVGAAISASNGLVVEE